MAIFGICTAISILVKSILFKINTRSQRLSVPNYSPIRKFAFKETAYILLVFAAPACTTVLRIIFEGK